MKSLIDEKTEYQQYFIARLSDFGYRERVAKEKYDKRYAMDTEELLAFLRDTQPEEMATLEKIHKIIPTKWLSQKLTNKFSKAVSLTFSKMA